MAPPVSVTETIKIVAALIIGLMVMSYFVCVFSILIFMCAFAGLAGSIKTLYYYFVFVFFY